MYNFYLNKTGRKVLSKILLIMRLTTLILITVILHVSATSLAQKISLSERNAPLSKIFEDISSQTGYDFAYTTQTLEGAKLVSINVKNEELTDVLKKIFQDQPLEYSIEDKSVVVSVKQPSLLEKIKEVLFSGDVTGRVLDEQGLPISSATVTVKGTSNATITDAAGYFNLHNVDDKAMIVISVIGYDKKEIPAAKNIGAVKLVVAVNKLDELQIIAYGESSQRLSVGNIASVSAKEIGEQPVQNPLLALEGYIPGLFITQSSGLPGTGVTVRIQGQNSIAKGNDPLYVIDGVPYFSQLLPTVTNILGGSGGGQSGAVGNGNPLSFINPSDIENIEVLKDADATAIYGSRAANGAILITTKKGKAGQTKVDINVQSGYGQVTRMLSELNTQQYLQMRHVAKRNDNASLNTNDNDINGVWDTTRYTNWQKVLLGGTAEYTDAHGSISGGSSSTQFLIGGDYHRETTVFPGNLSDQKGSMHFNINHASTNQKFSIQLLVNYMIDNNILQATDLTTTAIRLAPDAPALYNANGTLNWAPVASGTSTISSWINPLSYLYNQYQNKTSNLISNAILSYKLLPGLDIKSSFGYSNFQSNEVQVFPLLSTAPENRATATRVADFGNSNTNTWLVEPQITYKRTIAKGQLDILAGTTFNQNNSFNQQIVGSGQNSDAVLGDIKSATSLGINSSINSVYKYNAGFGRINYNWSDKYIFDLTARRDGSSRFGSNNQFHDFGSVGAAWIFSEEDLTKKNFTFLSYGKLRGSYGTTGNDQIGDYSFLNLYSPANYPVPYRGGSGLAPNSLPNPDLQWELTKKMQFGLDIGLFGDRLLFTANYYNNRSSNQLLNYQLPIITGFTSIPAVNFPATVQNYGWELILNTINIKTTDFSWQTSVNLTIPNNTLLAFPNIATSSYASQFIVGEPITITKVYHFLGVDPATGLYQYADHNGNPTTTPNSAVDKTSLINTSPKYYGGFQNSFRYKGFEISTLFQFVKQVGLNYYFGNSPGISRSNQPTTALNAWQKPGDIGSSIERYFTQSVIAPLLASQGLLTSDAAYTDASFIRLKNLSFSWQLPDHWAKKINLQNCRLFVQGQNLLTITNYAGLDPENRSTSALPPLRVLTFGIQVSL